jgi:hypothetical protein
VAGSGDNASILTEMMCEPAVQIQRDIGSSRGMNLSYGSIETRMYPIGSIFVGGWTTTTKYSVAQSA